VAHQEPEVRRAIAQLPELCRGTQHQAAIRVTRERPLHDLDHVIFVLLQQRQA
jgi:hypothetical protein